MLVGHTDKVYGVLLWQWNQNDRVVVLHEGKATFVGIVLDQGALSTHALLGHFVWNETSRKQCFRVVDVEAFHLCDLKLIYLISLGVFEYN